LLENTPTSALDGGDVSASLVAVWTDAKEGQLECVWIYLVVSFTTGGGVSCGME